MERGPQRRWRGAFPAAALLALAAVLGGPVAAQQVYKWKDDQGVIHYGDQPPAKGTAQLLPTGGQPAPTAVLPYALARTAQAAPVVLYTTARCEACDQGRALLRERGIPFAERTVSTREDEQRLIQLSGRNELPFLLIGKHQIAGFQAASWQEALNAAAYPAASQLPPGYRYEPPQPAVPTPPQGVRGQIKVPPDVAAGPEPESRDPAGGAPRAEPGTPPPTSNRSDQP